MHTKSQCRSEKIKSKDDGYQYNDCKKSGQWVDRTVSPILHTDLHNWASSKQINGTALVTGPPHHHSNLTARYCSASQIKADTPAAEPDDGQPKAN
jgi:hypothetical protein